MIDLKVARQQFIEPGIHWLYVSRSAWGVVNEPLSFSNQLRVNRGPYRPLFQGCLTNGDVSVPPFSFDMLNLPKKLDQCDRLWTSGPFPTTLRNHSKVLFFSGDVSPGCLYLLLNNLLAVTYRAQFMTGGITYIGQINFSARRRLPPSWRIFDALTAISNRGIVKQVSLLRVFTWKANSASVSNCGGIPIQRFRHNQSQLRRFVVQPLSLGIVITGGDAKSF